MEEILLINRLFNPTYDLFIHCNDSIEIQLYRSSKKISFSGIFFVKPFTDSIKISK